VQFLPSLAERRFLGSLSFSCSQIATAKDSTRSLDCELHHGSPTVPLQEETILNVGEFHGCGAFLVVVSNVIDPGAYGIAPHQLI
jgi:hypothetical protein